MGNICGDRIPDTSVPVESRLIAENKLIVNKVIREDGTSEIEIKELTDDQQNKISLIQNNWRKHKEKEKVVERIKVLESNMNSLGDQITIDEMKKKISSEIKQVQKKLPVYEGTRKDKENLEEKLIFRRPFKFNYDNSIYHGFWSSFGLREGYGVYITEEGLLQEGLWRDGKIYKGRIFEVNGNYFEGQITYSEPNGQGKKVLTNGTVYTGTWKNGKQIGQGERIYYDKFYYIGNFVDNLFSGKGKFCWPDGSIYEGDFSKSSIKGKGKFKCSNGEYYDGQWLNNLPNGQGCYTYSQDNQCLKFDGEFKNGKKEGQGKLTFKNGNYYTGEWKNGLPHGNGELKQNETIYKGFFRFGKLTQMTSDSKAYTPNTDVIIKPDKEKFKVVKADLLHLVDELEGENETTPNKSFKIYKASSGVDILNNLLS